jgi:hypothetical protein
MPDNQSPLATFDVNAAAKRMQDQIRGMFVDMLTPEQLEAAIKAEIHSFMTGEDASSFRGTCRQIFIEEAKMTARKELDSKNWFGRQDWVGDGNGGGMQVLHLSDHVKAWLTENAELLMRQVVAELMGGAAQMVIQSLRGRAY